VSGKPLLAGVVAIALAASGGAETATGVRVVLVGGRPELTAGRVWTARLAVRPASFRGVVQVTAIGPTRIHARARGGNGAYRAQLVFPTAGRWTLEARAGASVSRLGTVQVQRAREPLRFVWPTGVDVQPDGSLLLVENGLRRLLRIDPSTGRTAVIASLTKPYAVERAHSGSIFVTDGPLLRRIDGAARPVTVATADGDIGPIAISDGGDIYFTTANAIWKLASGAGTPVRIAPGTQVSTPHGFAIATDGTLLVADTGHNRILRVDPSNGDSSLLARLTVPRGMDVGADGTIYVVDGGTSRVVRLAPSGTRIGFTGPHFDDPYAVATAPKGVVYVIESLVWGDVRRIAADGAVTTVSRRP